MKSIVYFFTSSLLIILVSSCDKRSETSYSAKETTLNIDIPISAVNSDDSKSKLLVNKSEIPFEGTNDYQLSDVINSSSGIGIIRTITPVSGSVLSISKIKVGSVINSLHFKWGYKSDTDADYSMMEPIDLLALDHQLTEGVLKLSFDGIANSLLAEIKDANIMLRFEITGNCDIGLNGVANLEVPVIIESEILSPRFTLF